MSMKLGRVDLASRGGVLSTRDLGREVGREAIDSVADAAHVVVNFAGVDVASPPFLDELIVTLRPLTLGGDTGRLLVVAGLNDDVRETLEIVLERRKLVMAALRDERLELLGGQEQLDRTLSEAVQLGSFTAPELAERLKMKLPALHARLKALTDAGALAREADTTAERGVRHSYEAMPEAVIHSTAEELRAPQPA